MGVPLPVSFAAVPQSVSLPQPQPAQKRPRHQVRLKQTQKGAGSPENVPGLVWLITSIQPKS